MVTPLTIITKDKHIHWKTVEHNIPDEKRAVFLQCSSAEEQDKVKHAAMAALKAEFTRFHGISDEVVSEKVHNYLRNENQGEKKAELHASFRNKSIFTPHSRLPGLSRVWARDEANIATVKEKSTCVDITCNDDVQGFNKFKGGNTIEGECWVHYVGELYPIAPVPTLDHRSDGMPLLPEVEKNWTSMRCGEQLKQYIEAMWKHAHAQYGDIPNLSWDLLRNAMCNVVSEGWQGSIGDLLDMGPAEVIGLYLRMLAAQNGTNSFHFVPDPVVTQPLTVTNGDLDCAMDIDNEDATRHDALSLVDSENDDEDAVVLTPSCKKLPLRQMKKTSAELPQSSVQINRHLNSTSDGVSEGAARSVDDGEGRSIRKGKGHGIIEDKDHSVIEGKGLSIIKDKGHAFIKSKGHGVIEGKGHGVVGGEGHHIVQGSCDTIQSESLSAVGGEGHGVIGGKGPGIIEGSHPIIEGEGFDIIKGKGCGVIEGSHSTVEDEACSVIEDESHTALEAKGSSIGENVDSGEGVGNSEGGNDSDMDAEGEVDPGVDVKLNNSTGQEMQVKMRMKCKQNDRQLSHTATAKKGKAEVIVKKSSYKE
ncbi:hypothetical protein BKA93DRAFT_831235 [Sparassis latifolia]